MKQGMLGSGGGRDHEEPAPLWAKRLRARYPDQTRELDDAQLEEVVRAALAACAPLEITETPDVFRTIALRVLVTPEQKQSKLVEGTLLRIMCNRAWSPKKRLDFVYKHLIGRSVAKDETNFGSAFVPKWRPE